MERILRGKRQVLSKALKGQSGLTFTEMLAVAVVLVIIAAAVVFALFNSFGKVNGAELNSKSKNVENAVIETVLSDPERNIPAKPVTADGRTELTRKNASSTRVKGVSESDFNNPNDAAVVIESVARSVGLTGADLVELMRPLDDADVKSSLPGNVNAKDYYVVVKKAQLYKDAALDYFDKKGYNDELAGQVFSRDTIIDSKGIYYNGTHTVSAKEAKDLVDNDKIDKDDVFN